MSAYQFGNYQLFPYDSFSDNVQTITAFGTIHNAWQEADKAGGKTPLQQWREATNNLYDENGDFQARKLFRFPIVIWSVLNPRSFTTPLAALFALIVFGLLLFQVRGCLNAVWNRYFSCLNPCVHCICRFFCCLCCCKSSQPERMNDSSNNEGLEVAHAEEIHEGKNSDVVKITVMGKELHLKGRLRGEPLWRFSIDAAIKSQRLAGLDGYHILDNPHYQRAFNTYRLSNARKRKSEAKRQSVRRSLSWQADREGKRGHAEDDDEILTWKLLHTAKALIPGEDIFYEYAEDSNCCGNRPNNRCYWWCT
tara:strand:- start:4474 stop:5397 length:924 start_codon:yes stop_codon:yes gene_type:complete